MTLSSLMSPHQAILGKMFLWAKSTTFMFLEQTAAALEEGTTTL